MAELTDEQKAQAVLADNDGKKADQSQQDEQEQETAEDQSQVVEAQTDQSEDEEKPDDSEQAEAETPSFTKQFTNLKGESWEEYGPELENAYQNSFSEALRLKTELDKAHAKIAELEVGQTQAATTQETPAAPTTAAVPEIEYAKALMNNDMQTSFNAFSKKYPQVLDQTNFDKFTAAAPGIAQAFVATEGRQPLYAELYPRIAASLGWQLAEESAKKDAAIKESLAGQRTNSASTIPANRRAKVTEAQVDAYLRMYPAKNRADAVKELEEAVAS